jgi:hypothetical protein
MQYRSLHIAQRCVLGLNCLWKYRVFKSSPEPEKARCALIVLRKRRSSNSPLAVERNKGDLETRFSMVIRRPSKFFPVWGSCRGNCHRQEASAAMNSGRLVIILATHLMMDSCTMHSASAEWRRPIQQRRHRVCCRFSVHSTQVARFKPGDIY